MSEKTAVLMDGGFVKKKLQQTNHRFPTVPDVVGLYTATMAKPELSGAMGQKGVDMRIGLDIAWLSLKKIVDSVVLVTGDSDFVPAMKFARREGIRVYLETLGYGVRLELKIHADIVL